MNVIVIAWLAVEALGLVDAFRHPAADWHYADRERSFWVVMMFFLGPIIVLPYLVSVRPRFPTDLDRGQTERYLKR